MLNNTRKIRNKFAHDIEITDFTNKQIRDSIDNIIRDVKSGPLMNTMKNIIKTLKSKEVAESSLDFRSFILGMMVVLDEKLENTKPLYNQ